MTRKSSVSTLTEPSSSSLGAAARHTPEPWTATADGLIYRGKPDLNIAEVLTHPKDGALSRANAHRIVACVNALAGIPHPEHLPELIKALGLLDQMMTSEFERGADKPIRDALAKLRGE